MISFTGSRKAQSTVVPVQAGIQWRAADDAGFPPTRERRNVNDRITGAGRK
jgi:hypothetical protein